MTDDTQELRKLVEKAIQRAYYLGQEYWRLADSESWSDNRRSFDIQDKFDALRSETVSVAGAGVAALLEEIDALRAELQARQWQPIGTCPRKHGKHYLICKDCGPGSLPSISIGFCFDDQKDWHLMESNCTAEMLGYRVTHWHPLPLPPAPPQGDGA